MKHVILSVLFAFFAQYSTAQFIEKHNFPNAADSKNMNGNEFSYSFGQSVVNTLDGSQFHITQGFHQPNNTSTVNTQDILFVENFEIFPNPSSGLFQFNVQLKKSITGKVQIRNLLGQLISEHAFVQASNLSKDFDVSQQESGIYLIQIFSNNNTVLLSQKIIVQH